MTSAEASRYVSDKIVHKAVDAVGSATYPVDGGPWMVQEFRVGLEAVAGDIAAAAKRDQRAEIVRWLQERAEWRAKVGHPAGIIAELAAVAHAIECTP